MSQHKTMFEVSVEKCTVQLLDIVWRWEIKLIIKETISFKAAFILNHSSQTISDVLLVAGEL